MKNKLFSISIMMHPSREKYIPYLREKLGDIKIIFDEKNNIWDTCRRAWLSTDRDCKYGIIIQDDALITDNFNKKIKDVLKDDFVYSFYAGELLGKRIEEAEKQGLNYVLGNTILNEVALCMKTEHIDEMVAYCDKLNSQTDQDITKWASRKGLKIFYTIPSLVNHRDEESIYKKNYNKPITGKVRKAFRYKD